MEDVIRRFEASEELAFRRCVGHFDRFPMVIRQRCDGTSVVLRQPWWCRFVGVVRLERMIIEWLWYVVVGYYVFLLIILINNIYFLIKLKILKLKISGLNCSHLFSN